MNINVDIGFCSVYIQGYGLVNGATAMCAVGTWQGVNKAKDSDGEACTTCLVGYTSGDVGSIDVKNCSRECFLESCCIWIAAVLQQSEAMPEQVTRCLLH